MNDKLLSAISLCRKAGKLRMGSDVVKEETEKGTALLVLVSRDAAERSKRQARFLCEENDVKLAELPYNMEELWQVTGKRYSILAVCDSGFATMICKLLPDTTAE